MGPSVEASVFEMQRCYELGLRCLRSLKITNNAGYFFIFLHRLCEKTTDMTKVSFSARHFILARHSDKFDAVHGAECPPVELKLRLCLRRSHISSERFTKEEGTVCFHAITK